VAKHLNHEPQNIEYRMLNVEGKENSLLEIPCSIFDIQNRVIYKGGVYLRPKANEYPK